MINRYNLPHDLPGGGGDQCAQLVRITFPGGFPPKNEALLTSYRFSRVLLCPKEALVALINFQLGKYLQA